MKHVLTITLVAAITAMDCTASESDPVLAADVILHNGKIVTVNQNFDIESAIAIHGEDIMAVGEEDTILALAGDDTRILDLQGKTVIPGLIDGHYHFMNKAVSFNMGVDVALVDSIEEMVKRIGDKVAQTSPGELVYTTAGWFPAQLKENRAPTRHDLDPVSPNNPIIVQGGHSIYLNTYALDQIGITGDTASPEGGTIVMDPETGEPTGRLIDNAVRLALEGLISGGRIANIDAATHEQKREALRASQRKLNAVGVTSIHEPSLSAEDMRVYQELRDSGELTVRVSMGYSLDPLAAADQLIKELETWGVSTGFGGSMLRLGCIGEFGIDGGFEGGLMSEPYVHAPGHQDPKEYFGLQLIPTRKFEQVLEAMSRLGWRACIHVVGDRGLDVVLDAYEKADRVKAIGPKRWVIEHAHYTRPDQFHRMKDLGVVISTQFHPYMAAQTMVHFWGEERAAQTMRVRDWLDSGLTVGGGSDWSLLPANPFWMVYFWVTRDTRLGGIIGPEQKITREEALRVMTINNAYITFEEDIKGSLEPGKLADLLVLSDDILTVPEGQIKDITPLLTVLGGRIVYEATGALAANWTAPSK